jgi:hypothetical protein
MAALIITIEPDELLGLDALAELDRQATGAEADAEADAVSMARTLLREGLVTKLDELGLPWAPSPENVQKRAADAEAAAASSALRRLTSDARVRKYGSVVIAVAALTALWGGYVLDWQWTGFAANDQLWDWLHLLLLPVVFGTIPIWIQHADHMSRARRATYGAAVVVFAVFVALGYLFPLRWTGFPGNTLWDWFELIVLPAALVSVRAWPAAGRSMRLHQKGIIAFLALGWIVTLIGGYAFRWSWTGYQGNTLWDWLQLLLLPLVFPTILLPAALKWVSGNAAERAEKEAREAKEQLLRRPVPEPAGAVTSAVEQPGGQEAEPVQPTTG